MHIGLNVSTITTQQEFFFLNEDNFIVFMLKETSTGGKLITQQISCTILYTLIFFNIWFL